MTDITQGTFNWPPLVSGATMKARAFQITVNGAAPASALDAVAVVFKKDGVITITPDVEITNAALWQFTVGPVDAAETVIEPGIHGFDIATTDAAGVVEKYVGGTITILPSPR